MTWSFADAFTAADGTLVLGKLLTDGSGKRWRPGAAPEDPDATLGLVVQGNRVNGFGAGDISGRMTVEVSGSPWMSQCKVYGGPGDGSGWTPRVGPYAAGYCAVADGNDAADGDAIRLFQGVNDEGDEVQVGIYNLGTGVFLADGDVIRLDVNVTGNVTVKLNGTTRITIAWASGDLAGDHSIGFVAGEF